MTEPKAINRLGETDDGLRVVVKYHRQLYGFRSANVLERESEDLFTSTVYWC